MLRLLKQINAELGVTIVVITHEMEVVRAIADRVAVLDAGRVIELATSSMFSPLRRPCRPGPSSTRCCRNPRAEELTEPARGTRDVWSPSRIDENRLGAGPRRRRTAGVASRSSTAAYRRCRAGHSAV